VIRVFRNALDGADLDTLRRVEMADAFGALRRIDFVKLDALVNGLIGALGLADITVDAFFGNFQCQEWLPQLFESPDHRLLNLFTDEVGNVAVEAGDFLDQRR
jgi:hypothetical protein